MTGHCTGAILAGGRAVRYGGAPKGLEYVGGRRIIDRVADSLGAVCDNLLLVANDPAASRWLPGTPMASDRLRDVGSVAGIHAALAEAGHGVIVVAWDMPFVPASLLRLFRERSAGVDAVVPESGSKRGVEPLCAWYGPACGPAIERRVAAGDKRVIAFHDDVRVARIGHAEVARHGDPDVIFMNVNSPEELGRAERIATAADGVGGRSKT